MERKVVVKTVRLNHSNNHAEYTVKIDDIVVNMLVTSDFNCLQDWVQRVKDDETEDKKKKPKKRVLGLKVKYVAIESDDDEQDEYDDECEFDFDTDDTDDEVKDVGAQDDVQGDGVKDDAVRDDVQGDAVKDDELKDDVVKDAGAQDDVQGDAVKDDELKDDAVKDAEVKDAGAQDDVQGDAVKDDELKDDAVKDAEVKDEEDQKILAVFAVSYGIDCLIYQLLPETTRVRTSILIPFGLFSIFSSRDNVFVGRGIEKEIENLQPYFRFNIDNLTVVDVRSCSAHPSFNPPDMARSSLRSLGRRVLKRDIAPKYLGRREWDSQVLNKRQVESLAVTTFMSAKIGTTFGL